jgi:hypothetical protein
MPEKNDQEKSLADLEAELALFEAGVRSPFWGMLQTQWKKVVDTAVGAALSPNCPDRGFATGKANGMTNFLRYPEKHIKLLRVQIKSRKTGQPGGRASVDE